LRYKKGKGAVSADTELQELLTPEYPHQLVRETIECVFENEVADCRTRINHLLAALSACDYMRFGYYSTLCLLQLREEVDRRTVSAVSLPVLIDEVLSGQQELNYLHQLEHLLLESAYSIKYWQQESAGVEDNDIIQAAKKYILDNFENPALCAASVAEALKQSEVTLKRKFRTISGHALHSYINRVRLEKMAEALRSTTEPIKQLTERIGFANYAYFFTLFKKYYGVTPQQYRDRAVLEEI
ncbi:MAG: helix-turn-helix transcriptional regulator, partial [Spirochaetota bacterium]